MNLPIFIIFTYFTLLKYNFQQKKYYSKYLDLNLCFDYKKYEYSHFSLIRNEVFTRYGKTFKTIELADYFHVKDWYIEDTRYSDSLFTNVDHANLELIRSLEIQKFSLIEHIQKINEILVYTNEKNRCNSKSVFNHEWLNGYWFFGCDFDNKGWVILGI